MKARIVPAPATVELTPLANRSAPGECEVAGDSLRGWQEKRLELAGFEVVGNADETDLTLSDCAWLHDDALARVLSSGTPASFLSADDISAEDGFFIRYAWDFLGLNEEIVGSLDKTMVEGELHRLAVVEGKIDVRAGTRILPGVFIEGNVYIGRNCKIGPNCHLRGNSSIGDNCHIGQSVEIKNSVIMSNTNVGHMSYVGDSILARNVNFGAGTMTSNLRHDGANHVSLINGELIDTGRRKFGTVIGEGVHTGINTSIYPGRKIAAGKMTLPGEIVRKDVE